MKKWYKLLFISICNTVILIILLEISLSFIFQYNDKKRYRDSVDFKIASGVYQGLDPKNIKDLYNELYNIKNEWAPYIHFRFKESKGAYQNIDNNGIRKTLNLNLKDKKKAFKIFCLGGSTMFGTGVKDENTIPSKLSKYIYAEFPKKNIEITNLGAPGYIRIVENIQLQLEILNGNIPDMVLFYDGVNEVLNSQENNKVGHPINAAKRKKEFEKGRIEKLFLSSNIKRFITYLQPKIFKNKPLKVAQRKNLSPEIASQYVHSLRITKALGEQYGFKIYNFLQPVIYIDKPLTDHEKIMAKDYIHFEKLYLNSYKNILENNEIRKDSTFVDISNLFVEDTKIIYTDFCHIAERGNDSIAKKIFSYIESSIAQKKNLK